MSFQEAQIITGRNMGGIVFDVTIEEQHEDSLESPRTPWSMARRSAIMRMSSPPR